MRMTLKRQDTGVVLQKRTKKQKEKSKKNKEATCFLK